MKRTYFGTLGLAAILAAAAPAVAQEQPKPPATPAKPKVLITISKETTYITEPLRKDGYVDYVAALNQLCSKGVTPENNAAVPFLKAMGPAEINKHVREAYFKMLGMKPLLEKGDYYVTLKKYAGGLKPAEKPSAPSESVIELLWKQQDQAMTRPWSRKEFPVLADWLAANEKHLALVIEASNRPRRYDPLISCNGSVIGVFLSAVNQYREAARALTARAMLRVGEGKLEEAWQDLLACHRLARLAGQGWGLIDLLIAVTVDRTACAVDQGLLQHAQLTAAQTLRMRDDLARLPPMPKLADMIDRGERFAYLDFVRAIARDRVGGLAALDGAIEPRGSFRLSLDSAAQTVADWDQILRMGNRWCDRMAGTCRMPSGADRRAALRQIDHELGKLAAEAQNWRSLALPMLAGSREGISRQIGQNFASMFLPGASVCAQADDRATMQFELTKLGFALAAYRADHGSYPAKVAELAPKYAPEIPKDLFNDADLHYKPEGKGYLLYSVGPNGKDDGGKGVLDCKADEGWDDISIRAEK